MPTPTSASSPPSGHSSATSRSAARRSLQSSRSHTPGPGSSIDTLVAACLTILTTVEDFVLRKMQLRENMREILIQNGVEMYNYPLTEDGKQLKGKFIDFDVPHYNEDVVQTFCGDKWVEAFKLRNEQDQEFLRVRCLGRAAAENLIDRRIPLRINLLEHPANYPTIDEHTEPPRGKFDSIIISGILVPRTKITFIVKKIFAADCSAGEDSDVLRCVFDTHEQAAEALAVLHSFPVGGAPLVCRPAPLL